MQTRVLCCPAGEQPTRTNLVTSKRTFTMSCSKRDSMERWITAVILGSAAVMQVAEAQSLLPASDPAAMPAKVDAGAPDLPPIPRGKSTIFGGQIRELDPVRDQMTLRVFGDRPMKILVDERTQVFRDGKRISLRELRPEQQASVQTTLDGTKLFALSIH